MLVGTGPCPTQQFVASVRVNRTERARRAGNFQLMLHRVTRQCRVVRLDVQLEVGQQIKLA